MRRPSYAKIGRVAALAAFGLSVLAVTAAVAGLRINVTPSVPLGFYRTAGRDMHRGDYVMFCPPERAPFAMARRRGYLQAGSCPGGSIPMIKKILAAKDDRVLIGPGGIAVNGVPVPNSRPRLLDGAGRPLPRLIAEGRIADGDLLVIGESAASFDSRYFGPIPRSRISAVMRPIVTW